MNITVQELPIADHSRLGRAETNLLVIDHPNLITSFHKITDLVDFLNTGDIVVVNDSGTIPASFQGIHLRTNSPIEMRLAYTQTSNPSDLSNWMALLFSEGDWKIPTEDRIPPPAILIGDLIDFGYDLIARVDGLSSDLPHQNGARLIKIEFLGNQHELWDKIYRIGKPIQYSYLKEELDLWDQQTIFAGPPLSVESPSASFQLTWDIMFQLQEKGIEIIPITHAIGISSTGNEYLDTLTPFPERYWISENAEKKINRAVINGNRIVAFGTSVTRALEDSALKNNGFVKAGTEVAELKIDKDHKRSITSALLTGMHIPGESHLALLENFVPIDIIESSYKKAIEMNYLWHEYGDVSLILSDLVR
ncbi:MAG: S-adenosylmethionine:tRNA ribosyltransferase-isomerase [Candidatus Kariarchaeaceae archaeon]